MWSYSYLEDTSGLHNTANIVLMSLAAWCPVVVRCGQTKRTSDDDECNEPILVIQGVCEIIGESMQRLNYPSNF